MLVPSCNASPVRYQTKTLSFRSAPSRDTFVKKESMNLRIKPDALLFIVAIHIAIVFCGCRTAIQHTAAQVSHQKDSSDVELLQGAHGSIASQVQTHTDIIGNKWKITWHFDTSKPINPTTGLPPASGLEIEGSEMQKQMEKKTNVSSETSDSLSYHAKEVSSSDSASQQTDDKQTESGTSIERSIAAGIFVIIIIIAIILYARSNPPKQNH